MPGFVKTKIENERKKLSCPDCGNDKFTVEYGPVRKPVKGGHKMRYIGRCENGHEHHISYGYSK